MKTSRNNDLQWTGVTSTDESIKAKSALSALHVGSIKERQAATRSLFIRTVMIAPSGDQSRSIVPLSWFARTRLTILEP